MGDVIRIQSGTRGSTTDSSVDLEIQRQILRRSTIYAFPFAIVWVSLYYFFDEQLAALIILAFIGILSLNAIAYRFSRSFSLARRVRSSLGLLFPLLLTRFPLFLFTFWPYSRFHTVSHSPAEPLHNAAKTRSKS